MPDNMLVCIALDDAYHLGVLSSRIHVVWALRAGGWLGVGNDPRYSKSRCFDPFPFPEASDERKAQIRAAAEELDAHRKTRQAENPRLTITQMYNVMEKLKAGETLTEDEERINSEGLVLILKELHERLDALVFAAYGWPETLSEEEILQRLVDLNAERSAEEAKGQVRWLRPEYQIPKFGSDWEKAGEGADILPGNALPLKAIPLGTMVHNVELKPGKGGQIARSAGSAVQVVAREGEYASVKMPSGEIRKINVECLATIG
jgi:hypothetical protein